MAAASSTCRVSSSNSASRAVLCKDDDSRGSSRGGRGVVCRGGERGGRMFAGAAGGCDHKGAQWPMLRGALPGCVGSCRRQVGQEQCSALVPCSPGKLPVLLLLLPLLAYLQSSWV